MPIRILVLGLGNSIMGDDGVGVHALRRFQKMTAKPCLAVEVGTAVFDAVHMIENADRILAFDAVEAGGTPGSVYVLRAENVRRETGYNTLHDMGLIRTLETLDRAPAEVVIIGAEPQVIDWGTELSPALERALHPMISVAEEIITDWCLKGGTIPDSPAADLQDDC